jgi:chromosome segregation protein
VLVAPDSAGEPVASAAVSPPLDGAQRLLDHVRGPDVALALAHSLLRDAWLVDSLEAVPEDFTGMAVTRAGRVWSPKTRELRQAPAAGEERVLAQRNRRLELVRATEAAAQAEHAAAEALERTTAKATQADAGRDSALAAYREAVRERDDAAEERGRLAATIERRRSAPDDGPAAARKLQLEAQLSAERSKLERAERERAERSARVDRLRQAIEHDERLVPTLAAVIAALDALTEAMGERRAQFEEALRADRQAGEHLATELRACAQQEAALHAELHRENEALTAVEVRVQRISDRAAEIQHELGGLAARLELDAEPAGQELTSEERDALKTRLERLARRREQLGPVNPLAQQEYAEAVEHVEELERQRGDLETALRELEKLIADTDRQIRETFEHTFQAAARNFEEVAAQLFPGGRGRLRLVAERDGPARVLGGATAPAPEEAPDDDALEAAAEAELVPEEELLGVEIEITPAGKDMKRLSLLSGGEKSMTALAFLFAVFLARPCPFYILDEVEAALDDLNIDRFLHLLRSYSRHAQFIVVTHQKRTMEAADSLYGVSMGGDGISKVISRRLPPQEQAA